MVLVVDMDLAESFGKAKQSNADRMVAIAESFASQGAMQEDPGHGTGNPMNNRYFGPTDEQQVFWNFG